MHKFHAVNTLQSCDAYHSKHHYLLPMPSSKFSLCNSNRFSWESALQEDLVGGTPRPFEKIVSHVAIWPHREHNLYLL